MRNLPTEQELDASVKNPFIQNPVRPRSQTILTHRNGPHYWITQQQRLQCHSYDCRSQMLLRCNIPSMHDDNHRTPDFQTLSQPPILMVWLTQTSHQQQRPVLHVPLWPHHYQRTWNPTKPIHGVSPSNRQLI